MRVLAYIYYLLAPFWCTTTITEFIKNISFSNASTCEGPACLAVKLAGTALGGNKSEVQQPSRWSKALFEVKVKIWTQEPFTTVQIIFFPSGYGPSPTSYCCNFLLYNASRQSSREQLLSYIFVVSQSIILLFFHKMHDGAWSNRMFHRIRRRAAPSFT